MVDVVVEVEVVEVVEVDVEVVEVEVVDVEVEAEDAYAEHCRQSDTATAPLRDCLSYYNDHGNAEPGSLAYYGGRAWHRWRQQAQESMTPYTFQDVPARGTLA